MKLKFTHHAKYRLEERRISIEKVKQTINSPDLFKELPDGKIRSSKVFSGKNLLVIYVKSTKEFIILTAYYL